MSRRGRPFSDRASFSGQSLRGSKHREGGLDPQKFPHRLAEKSSDAGLRGLLRAQSSPLPPRPRPPAGGGGLTRGKTEAGSATQARSGEEGRSSTVRWSRNLGVPDLRWEPACTTPSSPGAYEFLGTYHRCAHSDCHRPAFATVCSARLPGCPPQGSCPPPASFPAPCPIQREKARREVSDSRKQGNRRERSASKPLRRRAGRGCCGEAIPNRPGTRFRKQR